jgi:ESS family glutamate:Na+ symporter
VPPAWKLNPAQVLALACLGVALGAWLKRKLPLLDRLDIPVPVVGGMLYALLTLALHGRVVNLEVDTTLRDLLMIAFMTTIGLNARLELIRKGGAGVVTLLVISTIGAALQNVLGIALATALHVDPRLGILTGSVALAGGPATAAAFGGTFEKLGVQGATTVALAAATFGIAVAGLIGAYIGASLIGRKRAVAYSAAPIVEPGVALSPPSTTISNTAPSTTPTTTPNTTASAAQSSNLLTTVLVVGVCIGLGNVLSTAIERLGVILPAYIGAMIVGAILRNLDDRFSFARIAQHDIDTLGRIALYLFIAMALLTLRLWEIARLALPMLVILAAQVAFCWLMCVTICYRGMGRNYEAAVTTAGFCGFMLGITANAVACMEELVEKYGPAPQAFLVVPIVGAFLIDFTNSFIITGMMNAMR